MLAFENLRRAGLEAERPPLFSRTCRRSGDVKEGGHPLIPHLLGGVLLPTKRKSRVWPKGGLHPFLQGVWVCVCFLAHIASCLIPNAPASQRWGRF